MSKIKLLNNLPLEDLTKENDYLGIIDKGNLIKSFLQSNTEQFHEIKMFALYGEWGSGKSTVLKYLEKELKDEFNTFYFDTWQYEKDDNLPKTLLEFLLYEIEKADPEIVKSFLESGRKLLKSLGRGLKIKLSTGDLLPVNGSVTVDSSKIVEEFEKEEDSFYHNLREFKEEFVRWEDDITREKKKYNIVFIDDLDRCEPENVLSLLSAIKLFFTYGEKTIFFFGVDKKAVNEAVKTKYKEVVKANEYLEKIFDISFNMPQHDTIQKLTDVVFKAKQIKCGKLKGDLNELICEFFKEIRFTNPRRIKKVLNKFLVVRNMRENLQAKHPYVAIMPSFYIDDRGNFTETIITLYLIIIGEFYQEIANKLNDFDFKMITFRRAFWSHYQDKDKDPSKDSLIATRTVESINYLNMMISSISLNNLKKWKDENKNQIREDMVLTYFLPSNPMNVSYDCFTDYDVFIKDFKVEQKQIDYYFSKYLLKNKTILMDTTELSRFKLIDCQKFIKTVL